MNLNPTFALTRIWPFILASVFFAGAATAVAGTAKFEAQVVWATNDENQPNDKYKPVGTETQKKLESLGLKWKKFYVVKRVEFEAKNGESGKVAISEKSSLSVKIRPDKKVEVIFYGKNGEECSRRVQTFKPGEMLVHGGNVPENATAWLVTLKQVK
jgi:hypothetical protein